MFEFYIIFTLWDPIFYKESIILVSHFADIAFDFLNFEAFTGLVADSAFEKPYELGLRGQTWKQRIVLLYLDFVKDDFSQLAVQVDDAADMSSYAASTAKADLVH